jgi:3D (Asp-Asp-Asp) domain-containing protein
LIGINSIAFGQSRTIRRPKVKSIFQFDNLNHGDIIVANGKHYQIQSGCLTEATAYPADSQACGTGDTTSSGGSAFESGVAADPKRFPIGTLLLIKVFGQPQVRKVDDKGGNIKRNRIDLRFQEYQSAVRFGRKKRYLVYVLKPVKVKT